MSATLFGLFRFLDFVLQQFFTTFCELTIVPDVNRLDLVAAERKSILQKMKISISRELHTPHK